MQQSSHGTQVATVALGGREIADVLSRIGYRFTLRPVRIFDHSRDPIYRDGRPVIIEGNRQAEGDFFSINKDAIDDVITKSNKSTINMSFGRKKRFDNILNMSKDYSSNLYIVAAGNRHVKLDDNPVYPSNDGE